MYHHKAIRRAPAPDHTQVRIAEVARRLLAQGAHDPPTKQFLRDVARDRYPFRSLQKLIVASCNCHDVGTSVALPEEIRSLIIAGQASTALPIAGAIELETRANHRANVAELRFFQGRGESRRSELAGAYVEQIETSRRALDALHALSVARPLTLGPR